MKKSRVIIGKILIILMVMGIPFGIMTFSGTGNSSLVASWILTFIVIATPVLFYTWLVLRDIEKKSSTRIEVIYHISIITYISMLIFSILTGSWGMAYPALTAVGIALISLIIFSIFMSKGITKEGKSASLRVVGSLVLAIVFSVGMLV